MNIPIINLFKTNTYTHPGDIINDIDKKELQGTRVTLINLPIREQAIANNAPMGPAFLAGCLQKYDVEVNIIDLNAYRIKDELSESRNLDNGRVLKYDEAEQFLEDGQDHKSKECPYLHNH